MQSQAPRRERRDTHRASTTLSALATAGTIAVVVLSLHGLETSWNDLGRHAAYIVLALTLPGTLVHKALRGSVGSTLGDLALGTTMGLALELAAWALASLVDQRDLLWVWPVATLVLVFIPAARARILERPRDPWPVAPLLAVVASSLMGFWFLLTTYAKVWPTAPSGVAYYPDLLWHMGLAAEARRAFPLGTPQVVGDGALAYHWFSHAHLAAASLISGSGLNVLWLRLWWVPVIMLGIILTAEVARRLSGSAWAGALAAALAASVSGWPFWPDIIGPLSNLGGLSPSHLFAVPFSLLTLHALVDLVRRPRGVAVGTAVVALLGTLACTGAKASTLPVLTGGLAIAFLAALVLRRHRVLLLVTGALTALITLGAMLTVAGGGSGQGFMLGHSLTTLTPYRVLVGTDLDYTQRVADGLWDTPGVGPTLLFGLGIGLGFAMIRGLAFVLPVLQPALRRDLAAWLVGGACLAALAPFLLLAHHGYSEYYFVYGTIPFGSALWAWSVVEVVGRSTPRRAVAAATAIVVAAATTWFLWSRADRATASTAAELIDSLREAILGGAIVLIVLTLVAIAARSRRPFLAALAPVASVTLLTPFVVGAFVPHLQRSLDPLPPLPRSADVLDESTAGVWIREHVPEEALLATNNHCLAGTGPRCDSRSWWISGIGERRVLLESWAYTPVGAVSGTYDPDLLALNDRAFTHPSPETLAPLRDLGVGWLVADHEPGQDQPSPRLDEVATRRWSNATITIYELTP